MNNFASRILELVNESPKQMTEIARDLGVSKQTLSAWCNGTRKPKPITLSPIANYFHTTTAWLQGEDCDKHPENYQDVNAISELYDSIKSTFKIAMSSNNGEKHDFLEVQYCDSRIKFILNGKQSDFSSVFLELSKECRRDLLFDLLKRYC